MVPRGKGEGGHAPGLTSFTRCSFSEIQCAELWKCSAIMKNIGIFDCQGLIRATVHTRWRLIQLLTLDISISFVID